MNLIRHFHTYILLICHFHTYIRPNCPVTYTLTSLIRLVRHFHAYIRPNCLITYTFTLLIHHFHAHIRPVRHIHTLHSSHLHMHSFLTISQMNSLYRFHSHTFASLTSSREHSRSYVHSYWPCSYKYNVISHCVSHSHVYTLSNIQTHEYNTLAHTHE